MANSYTDIIEGVDENGLNLYSYNQVLEYLQDSLTSIYAQDGEPINFDSETQDGQFTNILSQLFSDNRELVREIYNSFDPDNCSGSVQDSRYALNYIERKSGTFTEQQIDIVANQVVTLQGLDDNYNDVAATAYSVSDNSGQLWFLKTTTTLSVGTNTLLFRSQNYGAYIPTIGTITNQDTIVNGVVSVNNSVPPTTLGENQETDAEFKIRRTRSTTTHGQNNLDAMLSNILNLQGVTDAYYHNNTTNTQDSTGTAANTVWVIVEGGASPDIWSTIYQYSCGKPTRGSQTGNMISLSGETFPVSYDTANPVNLSIKFDYETKSLVGDDFLTTLKEEIVKNLSFKLNETAETSKITEAIRLSVSSIGGNGYPLNVFISTNATSADTGNWYSLIESTSLKNKFVVSTAKIYIENTLIS